MRSGTGGADVPCGSCRGCCRSSMFIRIAPDETNAIRRIPKALLFAAPGLPKGHVLMGYDDAGACPMLVDNECSIYEDRPRTCRNYDCRVFAATGIAVDPTIQAEIADRVRSWAFTYEGDASREEHRLLQETAAFLQNNRDLFPEGSLPAYPVQLAALVVRIYELFADLTGSERQQGSRPSDAAIAQAIVIAMRDERQRPIG
ncbi:MAG: YkgJ family cysteine cluster protein [Acidobacteriota bacterium]